MKNSTILAAALLVWSSLATIEASHEIPFSLKQIERLGITSAAVKKASWITTDRLPARVVIPPRQEHIVSAPSGGLITELWAGAGEELNAQDMLAKIESPALIALQRELLQAKTEERLAITQLKRDRQLFKEGIIAQRRHLESKSTQEQAAATLDERRQALVLAGMSNRSIAELEQTRRLSSSLSVSTPKAGVIIESMAVVGQRVERSDPLFRLVQLEPLWLEIQVPLGRLKGVRQGAEVELPCEDGNAQVTLIGRNVDPGSQTVLVRAEVHGVQDCLRPGQYVQVRLKLSSDKTLLQVPSSAVVHASNMTVVFVQAPFGFLATQVSIAGQQDGYSIVSGELQEGEIIAISGLAAIKAAWLGLGGGAE